MRRYRAKLSGPLLDRVDLQVPVPAVPWRAIASAATDGETSSAVRKRVEAARQRQSLRYRGAPFATNAELPTRELRHHCAVDPRGLALLEQAVAKLGLSLRAYVRVLRVARTIADLADCDRLTSAHVGEAISYRLLERDRPS